MVTGDVYQFIDEVVDGLSRFHEEDDAARFFEFRHHVLKGFRSYNLSAFGFVLEEVVDLGHGPVVRTHLRNKNIT